MKALLAVLALVLVLVLALACADPAARPATAAATHDTAADTAAVAVTEAACEAQAGRPAAAYPGRRVFEDTLTGMKGYRNARGAVVIPARYVAAYEFGSGGVAAVIDGTTPFAFIDSSGRVIARAYAMDNGPDYFQENRARILAGDRVGYIDPRGRIVIAPRFERALSFCHGTAEVWEHGTRFSIDSLGTRLPPA
ncbi:MAG: Leptospira repeat protein [Gemmatimonadetes bacterium]|nr:Leptospira repeat protein [Gemmatimonadota bacterium]